MRESKAGVQRWNILECPKYHTTLRTLCGGINEASCPRNFKCMASRFDPSIEICCRANSSIVYPEPDTCKLTYKATKSVHQFLAFRDNFIVPEHLPASPVTTVTVSYLRSTNSKSNFKLQFKDLSLAAGQLIANDDIDDLLLEPPKITKFIGDGSKFYTIMLFGMTT